MIAICLSVQLSVKQIMESSNNSIWELYDVMKENDIMMIYEGSFNQEMVKSVLAMTEQKLTMEAVAEPVIKKIYNIMMEELQNICKHQINTSKETINSMFVISSNQEQYSLVTGNVMATDNVEQLKNKIEKINNLNAEQLKELYKETRLNSVISKVGGAGLGFIDMARKSGNKLNYSFHSAADNTSFFLFEVNVNK